MSRAIALWFVAVTLTTANTNAIADPMPLSGTDGTVPTVLEGCVGVSGFAGGAEGGDFGLHTASFSSSYQNDRVSGGTRLMRAYGGFDIPSRFDIQATSSDPSTQNYVLIYASGLLTIGTLEDGQVGVPVTLACRLDTELEYGDTENISSSLSWNRNGDELLYVNAGESIETTYVTVYTGETVSFDFFYEYEGDYGKGKNTLSAWVVTDVPEPGTVALLFVGAMLLRRRK